MADKDTKLKITQVRSAVGRNVKQKRTLQALGVALVGRFQGCNGTTAHFADDLAENIDWAGGPYFLSPAHGCRAKEDAKGGAWRPIPQVTHTYHFLGILCFQTNRDGEVYLIPPAVSLALNR